MFHRLSRSNFLGVVVAVFAFVPAAWARSTRSQSRIGSMYQDVHADPALQDGLARHPQKAALIFALMDSGRQEIQDSAALRFESILINGPTRKGPAGFQVITPQAIAAVRGTKWAVDVGQGKTSVFVVKGRVAVPRPASNAGVVLGPGEGVDVAAGTGTLTVKRWPAARVSALMARFGQ